MGIFYDFYRSIWTSRLFFCSFHNWEYKFHVDSVIVYFAKFHKWLLLIKVCSLSEKSLKNYKIVELVNQIGCGCFSSTILPSLYTLGYWFTMVLVAAIIKMGAIMPLEGKLNFFFALTVFLIAINAIIKVGGDVVANSQETRHTLRNTSTKYLRKKLRGCRDVRIYFNEIFFFETGTFTVFMDSVINNAITIVLTI